MKFMYFYCSHLQGRNPTSRKGDYFKDIKAKFKEILETAKEKKVDYIFHGGDVTESPVLALNLADEIVDMIEDYGIPWYIIRGNHDEIGHNPNLSGQSILDHIFRRSNVITHLVAISRSKDKVEVRGYDYYHNIENDLKKNGLMVQDKIEGYKNIAIIHAFIVEKPFFEGAAHILFKDLKTDYDLVLLAHYHPYQGIVKIDGTTFVGIGSLARKTIGKGDTERIPNMLFVDTETQTMDIIPLKSIRPKDETFDFEVIEILKKNGKSIDDFINSLESVEVQGLEIRDSVEKICNENKVEKAIKDKIINKIDKIQESKNV